MTAIGETLEEAMHEELGPASLGVIEIAPSDEGNPHPN
jgi:hypothetical protein